MCRNKTHALLVSAFHHFGWNCGGTVANGKGGILHRGKGIPIQMTAAGGRKGKLGGKAKGLTNHTNTSIDKSYKHQHRAKSVSHFDMYTTKR